MPEAIEVLLAALSQNPPLFIGLSVLLGLMVGSFLNVVIYRLPIIMEREWHQNCLELQGKMPEETAPFSLAKPRSQCPHCGHKITVIENIPVLSYLFLKGRCSACKAPISIRYPLVELATGILIGLASATFGFGAEAVFAWILIFALITLTMIDFDTQLLPDDITLPLLWLGLLFNLNHGFADLSSAVIGAMLGYLILWSIYWLFKLVTGKEGMGYGDFKLLAAIGAWFGWQLLPAVILLSSVLGALIGIILIVFTAHGRDKPMPFGPFLAIGGIAALFYGQSLASLYLPAPM